MKYFVTVAGSTLELDVAADVVTLNGRRLPARLEELPGTPFVLLTLGNRVIRVLARPGASRHEYDISVEGHRFAVEALDERGRAIRELSRSAERAAGPAHLVAPMPGLIVRVAVQAGAKVQAGQGLVVMEAMKMENELRAASAGVVKRVAVSAGTAVEKGALLLEMEA